MIRFKYLSRIGFILVCSSGGLQAYPDVIKQDTVSLNLKTAEQRFINENLSLLSAKYDIDIAKSNILQSRLWYNPNLSYSQGIYNGALKRSGNNGEHDVQLHQLFSLAGKHRNAVRLARILAEKSEYAFEEFVRDLKFELYSNYSNLYAAQEKIKVYNGEITNLHRLITATDQQLKLGAIAGNEVIRLKAELQNIKNQSVTTEAELEEAEKNLKILLNYDYNSFLVAEELPILKIDLPPLQDVITQAEKNRPDLMAAHTDVKVQHQNLKLQRSQAIPDLTLGLEYDEASASVPYFYGAGASMDIPLFNRNQGQVLAAKKGFEKSKLLDTLALQTVRTEVVSAYSRLNKIKLQLADMDPSYGANLEQLIRFAVENYNKRYISLLEFLDQLRTYANAKESLIELNDHYFSALHYLNFTTGTDIIK